MHVYDMTHSYVIYESDRSHLKDSHNTWMSRVTCEWVVSLVNDNYGYVTYFAKSYIWLYHIWHMWQSTLSCHIWLYHVWHMWQSTLSCHIWLYHIWLTSVTMNDSYNTWMTMSHITTHMSRVWRRVVSHICHIYHILWLNYEYRAQGVVYETLELSDIKGYTTGGSIHIIANNQVTISTDIDVDIDIDIWKIDIFMQIYVYIYIYSYLGY